MLCQTSLNSKPLGQDQIFHLIHPLLGGMHPILAKGGAQPFSRLPSIFDFKAPLSYFIAQESDDETLQPTHCPSLPLSSFSFRGGLFLEIREITLLCPQIQHMSWCDQSDVANKKNIIPCCIIREKPIFIGFIC